MDLGKYKIRKCCNKIEEELEFYEDLYIENKKLYYSYFGISEDGEDEEYWGTIEECPFCGKKIIIYELVEKVF